jgi:hypothetical protein
MSKEANEVPLFKNLKQEIRQLCGVAAIRGIIEDLIVVLEEDTPEIRDHVLKTIEKRYPPNEANKNNKVTFEVTEKIVPEAVYTATKIKILNIDGVAAFSKLPDKLEVGMQVFLFKDTPEIWMKVLTTIGDEIPPEKIKFIESRKSSVRCCSFCGKERREVLELFDKNDTPPRICDQCIDLYAQIVSEARAKDKSE